ncbi:hypothetical protein CSPX01_06770 [Colletotrichum filicis]|nr:hypothetical protein CSPX01_06770 [Colletotrichum filicis]
MDGDVSEFYGSWGFTIYRTAYGPGTDAQWRTLLDKIRAQVVSEIECYLEAGDEDVAAQLKSLFVLDARSDAALWDKSAVRDCAGKELDGSAPQMM